MVEIQHPFVDNGNGCPTLDSAQDALRACGIGRFVGLEVSYAGHTGPVDELVTLCRIDRLTQNWPRGFVAQVTGIVAHAAQPTER